MDAQPPTSAGPGDRRTRWVLPETATAVLVAVMGARIVLALISGVLTGYETLDPSLTGRLLFGSELTWSAGFGDEIGVFLLAGAVALLWWQLNQLTGALRDGQARAASAPPPYRAVEDEHRAALLGHLRRWRGLCRWVIALGIATVVGAVALTVAYVADYWGYSDQWRRIVGTGGFQLSYAVLATVALIAAIHLSASARQVEGLTRSGGPAGPPTDEPSWVGPPAAGSTGAPPPAGGPAWEDPAPFPPPVPGTAVPPPDL